MRQEEGVYCTGTCCYSVLTWLNLPLLSPVLGGEEKEPECHQSEEGEPDVTPSQLAQRAQAMMITTSSCSTRLLQSVSQGHPYPVSLSKELHLWRELKKPFQRLILSQCRRQSQKRLPQTPLRKLQSLAQSERGQARSRCVHDYCTANLYSLHFAL
uniref:Uncharacterized protein n=1 Tax=Knipowitschia caucasica TaxID=637954 RepID=A0AAV2IZ54_KNICA